LGTAAQLWTGARHQPVSRGAANPRSWSLHHDVRHWLGARSDPRRRTGATVRLARGVLGSRADRAVGVLADLEPAARHTARPAALRCARRGAAGGGDHRTAADVE